MNTKKKLSKIALYCQKQKGDWVDRHPGQEKQEHSESWGVPAGPCG